MARRPRRWPVALGRPATWEDLLDLPHEVIGEIVGGEIVVSPRPAMPHQWAASRLGVLLGGPFDVGINGPGGWIILDEPYLRFGEDIRAPDLAGWRAERWTNVARRGPINLIPDWICEILSPSTETEDRTAKRDLYAHARVNHLWLIDPDTRTLEVHRLTPDGWLLVATCAEDQKVRAGPFEAVALDLAMLWEGIAAEPPEE